jgi:hypothetical protein
MARWRQAVAKKAAKSKKPRKPVAIVSYDEKPGIQGLATTAPDLPPVPGVHATFARDHEHKRHGTLSLLAGIDLLTGKVHALVRDRHRSREFIEFLKNRSTTKSPGRQEHNAVVPQAVQIRPSMRASGTPCTSAAPNNARYE